MRVPIVLLLTCIAVPIAGAQLPGSANPQAELLTNQGVGNRPVSALDLDQAKWAPHLALVSPEEKRVFRTFRVGMVINTARVDCGPEGSVLIGIEANVSRGRDGVRVNSLRAIYSSAGNKSYGAKIGDGRGQLERSVAKEGYAVQDIVFSTGAVTGITGISLWFAPILPDGTLDKSRAYAAPAIGQGGGTTLGLENLPFCGIYATPGEEGAPVTGAAMLVSQKLIRAKAPALMPRPVGAPSPNPETVRTNQEVIIVREHVTTHLDPSFADFIRANSDKLFFIEGAAGKGSGFTCKLRGKTYLFTNQHVIVGNPKVKFAGLTKATLNVSDAQAASGHDVMAYPVPDGTPAFELIDDLTRDVAVGDVVAVLGDAEGAGVVRPIAGRVAGIGPNLIEVSAEFLPGNSGSPIIHLKTGRVIGIATYVSSKPIAVTDFGHVEYEVRRFGYRLDSIQKWQPVAWPAFQADSSALHDANTLTQGFLNIGESLAKGTFNNPPSSDPRLRPAFSIFPMSSSSTLSLEQQAKVRDGFVERLRKISAQDLAERRARIRYDYLREMLNQEEAFREMIFQEIDNRKASIRVLAPPRR